MIIDSHVHIGKNSPWGSFEPEYLLRITEKVDYLICSNIEGIDSQNFKNELDCNIEMLETSRKYPKIKPLMVCQPNISEDENQVRKLLEMFSEFIGLKFHPECMKLAADNFKYDKYLKLAEEFGLPCLYHSGHIKSKYSSPCLIYKKAQEFPTVPIILGHLSTGPRQVHIEAIEILLESIEKNNSNLFVDISWIDFAYENLNETYEDTIMLIKALKNTKRGDYTNRILWGSDCPVGKFNHTRESYEKNLETFKQRILESFNDEYLLENLLSRNAMKLYKLY